MKKRHRPPIELKASLTLEAALVLPTVLFALFSLIYMIQVFYIHEQIQSTLVHSGEQMAVYAYAVDKSGLLDLEQDAYRKSMENREEISQRYSDTDFVKSGFASLIITENQSTKLQDSEPSSTTIENLAGAKAEWIQEISGGYTRVQDFMAFISILMEDLKTALPSLGLSEALPIVHEVVGEQLIAQAFASKYEDRQLESWGIIDGLEGLEFDGTCLMLGNEDLDFHVRYKIRVPFLPEAFSVIEMEQAFTARAFTGNENFESAFNKKDSDESEETDEGEKVYVTKTGKRYHLSENCNYIDVKLKAKTFGEVEGEKRPCAVCGTKSVLTALSIIYTTDKSDIYHTTTSCKTIKRDVRTLMLEDAISQGYTPCKKCGGE